MACCSYTRSRFNSSFMYITPVYIYSTFLRISAEYPALCEKSANPVIARVCGLRHPLIAFLACFPCRILGRSRHPLYAGACGFSRVNSGMAAACRGVWQPTAPHSVRGAFSSIIYVYKVSIPQGPQSRWFFAANEGLHISAPSSDGAFSYTRKCCSNPRPSSPTDQHIEGGSPCLPTN